MCVSAAKWSGGIVQSRLVTSLSPASTAFRNHSLVIFLMNANVDDLKKGLAGHAQVSLAGARPEWPRSALRMGLHRWPVRTRVFTDRYQTEMLVERLQRS